jgi:DNA-binding transcriptional LysR family regulator
MTVEIRHLRAFLAIADELNLTRAARRLNLTQPALSRTLAQLERDLGTRLVERSTHHVALTEAGQRFEQHAFDAVRAFEQALAGAVGQELPLRLGHSWSSTAYLSGIVRAWNDSSRPCALSVIRIEDRSAGLTSGQVDAGLTRGPIDAKRFRSVVLDEESRVAVLHVANPLSRKRSVTLADLADGTLVPTQVGTTTAALWPEDRRPQVGTEVATLDDWLVAIAAGAGFGVSVASTAVLHRHPDVRYVPVVDAPPVPLLLAWPRRGEHPAIKELVRTATASVRARARR